VQAHCALTPKEKNVEKEISSIPQSSNHSHFSNEDPQGVLFPDGGRASSKVLVNKNSILCSDVEVANQVLEKQNVNQNQRDSSVFLNINEINITGSSHLSINLPRPTEQPATKSIENLDLSTENLELIKISKEKESAIRSLKTNLTLICILFFICLLFLLPPKNCQFFLTALNESVQKSLLPILTTMANFLPIQSTITQYVIYLKTLFCKI
jgi:hypothetical protein